MSTHNHGHEDLWPDSFESAGEDLPLDFVREQAKLLWNKTQKFVEGNVVPLDRPPHEDRATYAFMLMAPAISYSFRLFTMEQGLDPFPFVIQIDSESTICSDLDAVKATLSKILQAEDTRKVIAHLISMSRQQ